MPYPHEIAGDDPRTSGSSPSATSTTRPSTRPKLADPKAFATKQYQEVLDRKDIDAVLIGAPDHWHVPMTVEACEAGKDVYVEKPLTHDLAEGKGVIEAQNEHKRIVQVGTQQRSMPHFAEGGELVRGGADRPGLQGPPHLEPQHATAFAAKPRAVDPKEVDWKAFLGNAPDQPFDEYRFRNWRWFWDFGGGILTDLMVHFIDVGPLVSSGSITPSRRRAIGEQVAAKGVWETPDTIQCLLTIPGTSRPTSRALSPTPGTPPGSNSWGPTNDSHLDRGGYELYPRAGQGQVRELILGTDKRRGRDFYDKPDGELLHLANWVGASGAGAIPPAPSRRASAAANAALPRLNRAYLRKDRVAALVGNLLRLIPGADSLIQNRVDH